MMMGSRQGGVACLVLLGMLVASPIADAHHIRGIPHYSYNEGYPQAPSCEEQRTVGQFELRFTFFQVPGGKKSDLALYIKDTKTGKPFEGEVVFTVYGEREDPMKAHSSPAYRNKVNIYKVGWVYEEDGIYFARATFESGGVKVDEAFRFAVGESGVSYIFLGGVFGGVIILIIVVAMLNRGKANAPK